MSRLTQAMAGASVLVLCALPVSAQAQGMGGLSGILSGGYGNADYGGSDADIWAGGLGAVFNSGSGWNLEGNAAYGNASAGGWDADAWGFGGAAFWRDMRGAIGANIQYTSVDYGSGSNFNTTSYGVLGEYYLNNQLTLRGEGGGYSGSGNNDGWYIGGNGIFYPTPNFALNAGISHSNPD